MTVVLKKTNVDNEGIAEAETSQVGGLFACRARPEGAIRLFFQASQPPPFHPTGWLLPSADLWAPLATRVLRLRSRWRPMVLPSRPRLWVPAPLLDASTPIHRPPSTSILLASSLHHHMVPLHCLQFKDVGSLALGGNMWTLGLMVIYLSGFLVCRVAM